MRVSVNPAPEANPFARATRDYQQVRPHYPAAALAAVQRQLTGVRQPRILDVGAGTGKMTLQLRAALPEAEVVAMEPAKRMRVQLQEACPDVEIIPESLETYTDSGAQHSFSVIVCAQSFHWLDPATVGQRFAQLLQPDGAVVIVNNQMRVELPWVKRLTRIMRSGDVHRLHKPPELGPGYTPAELDYVQWKQRLTVPEVLQLARTRSAYLRSDRVNRARMQANLRWYLEEYLQITGEQVLPIPYETHIWSIQREGA